MFFSISLSLSQHSKPKTRPQPNPIPKWSLKIDVNPLEGGGGKKIVDES